MSISSIMLSVYQSFVLYFSSVYSLDRESYGNYGLVCLLSALTCCWLVTICSERVSLQSSTLLRAALTECGQSDPLQDEKLMAVINQVHQRLGPPGCNPPRNRSCHSPLLPIPQGIIIRGQNSFVLHYRHCYQSHSSSHCQRREEPEQYYQNCRDMQLFVSR